LSQRAACHAVFEILSLAVLALQIALKVTIPFH
jgi:hypothetical protein